MAKLPPNIELDRVCYLRVRLTGYYPAFTHEGEAVVHLVDKDGCRIDALDRVVPLAKLIPGKTVQEEIA